jgi:hypothetical protein
MAVQVNVNEDEKYPYYFVTFADDPRDEDYEFYPTDELSDEEAADLKRVRDEHREWQHKLGEMHEEKRRASYRTGS